MILPRLLKSCISTCALVHGNMWTFIRMVQATSIWRGLKAGRKWGLSNLVHLIDRYVHLPNDMCDIPFARNRSVPVLHMDPAGLPALITIVSRLSTHGRLTFRGWFRGGWALTRDTTVYVAIHKIATVHCYNLLLGNYYRFHDCQYHSAVAGRCGWFWDFSGPKAYRRNGKLTVVEVLWFVLCKHCVIFNYVFWLDCTTVYNIP